jgi:hypothetical protein
MKSPSNINPEAKEQPLTLALSPYEGERGRVSLVDGRAKGLDLRASIERSMEEVALAAIAFALLLALLFVFGCTSTVVPGEVKASVASWDGTQQNSGLLGFDQDGNAIITYHAYNRFAFLVGDYGPYYKPPVLVHTSALPITNYPVQLFGSGKVLGVLTNPVAPWPPGPGDWPYWRMDAEHLQKFVEMNRWRKQGKAPFK